MIVGIDPGLNNLGLAILEKKDNDKISIVFTKEIRTKSSSLISDRLWYIYDELDKVFSSYSLTTLGIEESFVNMNNKSSLKLSMVCGIVLALGAKYKLQINSVAPTMVKKAITGHGYASKEDVYYFIREMVENIPDNLSHHIYDAIAIGFLAT